MQRGYAGLGAGLMNFRGLPVNLDDGFLGDLPMELEATRDEDFMELGNPEQAIEKLVHRDFFNKFEDDFDDDDLE